ncbi:serine hydrolase domain-containing protein [Nocardia takedensis]|uniref:serine hydrolase domain-containing protein n=1 Tax=Nocardia takedensis TaxID=259390 RepID=UPI003F75E4FC
MVLSHRLAVVCVTAALVLGSAAAGSAAPDARADAGPDPAALRRAMDAVVAAGASGVQVRVRGPWGEWVGTAGSARWASAEPVPTDGVFRAGSVTKTFVATVLLQLVAEGRVGPDDSVVGYLPRFDLDERVTVGMILGHTSGLRGYAGEAGPDGQPSPSALTLDPGRTYRPEDLVRFALAQPAWFEPGARWHYSNTNYLLAGLLIEQITGTPYARQVEERILRPLGLADTSLPGTSPEIPPPHAHGYLGVSALGVPIPVDVTALNPSMAWAAGEILSTTADLEVFLDALLTGRLLPRALLARMTEFRPTSSRFGVDRAYGLGLVRLSDAAGCSGIGHSGDIPGFHTEVYHSPDGARQVAVSVTQGALDSEDRARFSAYLTAAYGITAVGLCDAPA